MIVQILKELLLDPIYTGKVMAGLIDLVDKNIIDKNIPVIFIHTGGMPIIFSFESSLVIKLIVQRFIHKMKLQIKIFLTLALFFYNYPLEHAFLKKIFNH